MSLWSLDTSPPLKELYLDHNHLTGLLPNTTQLGQAMQKIWLNDNHFSGEIPLNFAVEWKKLVELKVQSNNLTGLLGPPVQANHLAKTCPKIWPFLHKLVADCLERLVTDKPPVQCDCCTDCEGLRRL